MRVIDKEGEKLDLLSVNIGPSHPATHGSLRAICAIDGEKIVAASCEIGYLHRGFEKMVERGTYQQVMPYTDRLNYCSAMLNNIGFCKAVEGMFGIELTERATTIRVIISEMSRFIDHIICIAAALADLGAQTAYFYLFVPREEGMIIWEKLTGARLTNSYARIGGLFRDLYEGFEDDVARLMTLTEKAISDVLGLVDRNKIFLDRTQGVAIISQKDAISYGWTGPCLRATGVDRDMRKEEPYYGYDTYDFDTIVGSTGDTYDRLMVRVYEVRESISIMRQALKRLKPGPINVEDPRVSLPQHSNAYHDMESLINRFKLVYEGVHVPKGEHYDGIEAANGELGFFIVSDGTGNPWRIKVRPPCLTQFAAYAHMVEGSMIPDAVACLSSINIIAGELDR
jgi:NADH-quinone oxidoreductase subunit D/NADH-quinone oxidoreductase subunit C/D